MTERPPLFDDPNLERVGQALMALAAEVSVLSDRTGAILALAEARGLFTDADVETYLPDDARSARWQRARQAMIAKVFKPLVAERGV